MKKALLGLLLVLTLTLTGCDQVEETVTDLQSKLTTVTSDLDTAVDTIDDLDSALETAETTITDLQTDLDAAEAKIAELESSIADAKRAETHEQYVNAMARDDWKSRNSVLNQDWTTTETEYCFGVYDTEDWSTLVADDYKVTNGASTGLKFVITIEKIEWGTEIFAKDSCGNYSNFIFDASKYGFYSAPAAFFEEGATYEVVLYKEVYMAGSPAQLGFLPEAVLEGDYNSYPADLSGIQATKKEN